MKESGKQAAGMPPWAWGALVVMVCLIVFLPALRFPFMPFWDDDVHVHANPHLANLSWSSIAAFWSGPWQQLYIPVTYSVWAGLAALSRMADGLPAASGALNAAWFHGANVSVHAVSVALAFLLLRRVTGELFPAAGSRRTSLAAALGAAFFALHPLQVEPVAWISGLRDVLGGCLGLAALLVMFGTARLTPLRWMVSTLIYLASLAAKPAGVALPLVAVMLAVVPFHWPRRRIILMIGPWLLAGVLWVLVTSHAQWAAELAGGLVPAWMRPLIAADALAFYLGKVAWPSGLAADYGRSPDSVHAAGLVWWTWIIPAAVAGILAIVKPWRIFLLPLGIFTAALLPTLGLVPFNFQVVSTVADRYAYFALLGPALALAMITAHSGRAWVTPAAAIWVGVLVLLTMQRLPLWSEDLRLFAATLEVNPRSWKAMHNYASALDDRGRPAEAEPMLRKVIALRPDSSEACNDLAVILWNLNRPEEAVGMLHRSLNLRPTSAAAHNLVQMEAALGNMPGVIEALRAVVELEPGNAEAAAQLARLRGQEGL